MHYSAPRWWHRAQQGKEGDEGGIGDTDEEPDTALLRPLPPARRDGAGTRASRVQVPWTMPHIALRDLRTICTGPGVVAGPKNAWTGS
jgi:hypothetical protein